MEVVGEAGDGREAIEVIERLQPRRRGARPLHAGARRARGDPADPPGRPRHGDLVFSGFEEGKVAEVALRLKASRYVRKGAPLEELRSAVRELAA